MSAVFVIDGLAQLTGAVLLTVGAAGTRTMVHDANAWRRVRVLPGALASNALGLTAMGQF